jgi:hypothetical protein
MKWLIWSNQHAMWWRAAKRGYTQFIEEAGRYDYPDAVRIVADATLDGQLRHERVNPVTGESYISYDEVLVLAPEAGESSPPAPAGPADDDRVWISVPRRGIEMHALAAGNTQATGCGRSRAAGGITVLAHEAVRAWECQPCPRCWPGAAP